MSSIIDLDFFEKVIFQQVLKKDNIFLASCVEYLEKGIFKNKDISEIIGVIKDFYIENDTIPTHTELKARVNTPELKNHLEKAVKSIRDLDKEYNETELIKNTEYFLKQRKFDLLLERVIDEKSEKKEIDLDAAQQESEAIHTISLIENMGLDYFGDNEVVVKYLQETDTFISTGYTGLDKAIGGGLHKEGRAIYGIGGETNVGKSLLVGNIVTNVIRQKMDVVLITLEMSEKRYAKRISGILTGLAIDSLGEHIDDYQEYIKNFVAENKARLIIKEFAAKTVSAKNIFAFIKKLERKKGFNPALIALDYHTLLKASSKQITTTHGEIQRITQEARGLSYVFECPLVTPMQLNRTSHKAHSPGLDSISGSWDSASDFDSIITLSQTDEDREANNIQYAGKKVRDGAKGNSGALKIDYSTLRFFEENAEPSIIRQMDDVASAIDFASLYE